MLSREDIVTQSAIKLARQCVAANFTPGTGPGDVEMMDSFPYKVSNGKIDHILLASGFNLDDEGKQAEMGSDLKHRVYTVEFWVFAPTLNESKNLANVIKFAFEKPMTMPLYDFAQVAEPVFDHLIVEGASATRQIHPDPEPWQEFVYTTTVKLQDEYYASASFPVT